MRFRCGTAITVALGLMAPAQALAHTYTVRPGDTLTSIAAAHGTSVAALASANGIVRPNLIVIGQRLSVPSGAAATGGGTYRVRPGDTLSDVALRFGTTVEALARLNGIRFVDLIRIGTLLRLPTAGTPAPSEGTPVPSGGATGLRIDYWAGYYGVDRRLARALAWMESGYQHHVVSSAGARGAMQVTDDAWDFVETVLFGARVARTADGNVRVGVAYLAHLLRRFDGDERLALGAYYQGAAAVRRHGLFRETRAFVADVLALKARM